VGAQKIVTHTNDLLTISLESEVLEKFYYDDITEDFI
jgi:hypothetical protein